MAEFDVVITGARVVDGTGNPWFYGDVALRGERIAAITAPGHIAPTHARHCGRKRDGRVSRLYRHFEPFDPPVDGR